MADKSPAKPAPQHPREAFKILLDYQLEEGNSIIKKVGGLEPSFALFAKKLKLPKNLRTLCQEYFYKAPTQTLKEQVIWMKPQHLGEPWLMVWEGSDYWQAKLAEERARVEEARLAAEEKLREEQIKAELARGIDRARGVEYYHEPAVDLLAASPEILNDCKDDGLVYALLYHANIAILEDILQPTGDTWVEFEKPLLLSPEMIVRLEAGGVSCSKARYSNNPDAIGGFWVSGYVFGVKVCERPLAR